MSLKTNLIIISIIALILSVFYSAWIYYFLKIFLPILFIPLLLILYFTYNRRKNFQKYPIRSGKWFIIERFMLYAFFSTFILGIYIVQSLCFIYRYISEICRPPSSQSFWNFLPFFLYIIITIFFVRELMKIKKIIVNILKQKKVNNLENQTPTMGGTNMVNSVK